MVLVFIKRPEILVCGEIYAFLNLLKNHCIHWVHSVVQRVLCSLGDQRQQYEVEKKQSKDYTWKIETF